RTALVDAPHHPVRAFLEVHHDRGEAPVTIRGTIRTDYGLATTAIPPTFTSFPIAPSEGVFRGLFADSGPGRGQAYVLTDDATVQRQRESGGGARFGFSFTGRGGDLRPDPFAPGDFLAIGSARPSIDSNLYATDPAGARLLFRSDDERRVIAMPAGSLPTGLASSPGSPGFIWVTLRGSRRLARVTML
ncbi:MAG: hypothetical protein ACK6CU_17340, partial [Deltaproteobacteria bacterium]